MDEQERVFLNYTKVKYYCKKNNWTISELATKLGVTRQTIRSWSLKPTFLYNIWLLEDVLGVATGELQH